MSRESKVRPGQGCMSSEKAKGFAAKWADSWELVLRVGGEEVDGRIDGRCVGALRVGSRSRSGEGRVEEGGRGAEHVGERGVGEVERGVLEDLGLDLGELELEVLGVVAIDGALHLGDLALSIGLRAIRRGLAEGRYLEQLRLGVELGRVVLRLGGGDLGVVELLLGDAALLSLLLGLALLDAEVLLNHTLLGVGLGGELGGVRRDTRRRGGELGRTMLCFSMLLLISGSMILGVSMFRRMSEMP